MFLSNLTLQPYNYIILTIKNVSTEIVFLTILQAGN